MCGADVARHRPLAHLGVTKSEYDNADGATVSHLGDQRSVIQSFHPSVQQSDTRQTVNRGDRRHRLQQSEPGRQTNREMVTDEHRRATLQAISAFIASHRNTASMATVATYRCYLSLRVQSVQPEQSTWYSGVDNSQLPLLPGRPLPPTQTQDSHRDLPQGPPTHRSTCVLTCCTAGTAGTGTLSIAVDRYACTVGKGGVGW